ETVIIFSTIATWMSSIGLPDAVAGAFGGFGAYGVGAVELVAAVLLLLPATRRLGAVISLAVISGAIFFHAFTPLGTDRVIDQAGNTDGGALFYTAVAVWLASLAVIGLSARQEQSPLSARESASESASMTDVATAAAV
ncbi:MAG: hypothetical protein AAGG11_19010, partial [Pseudomonadota bacterium]